MIDLQSHSTFSDGELPPTEVVASAVEAGVKTLALTDHDGIDGVAEAGEAASAAGIVLIPAAEIFCVHRRIDHLHNLGYLGGTTPIPPALERAPGGRGRPGRGVIRGVSSQG